MTRKDRDWEDSEAQWRALFGEDLSVSPKTLEKYLAHLNEHLTFPCEATGIEDFPWEEKYIFGHGDKKEYERLKQDRISYADKFLIEKLVHDESYDGILAKVLRGKQEFDVPLDLIKATDQDSTNCDLLDDYAVWFVNCGD
jgi:hypothetical protein